MSGFRRTDIVKLEMAVCEESDLSLAALKSDSRMRELIEARWVLWYLANRKLGYSASRLARLYTKDHTTVLHGLKKVQQDPELMEVSTKIFLRSGIGK